MVLCFDRDRARLFALAGILRAGGYLCILSDQVDQAERNLSSAKVDLVVAFEHTRASVLEELKQIRKVPVLMLEDSLLSPKDGAGSAETQGLILDRVASVLRSEGGAGEASPKSQHGSASGSDFNT
jgi:hypothetical protein